MGARPSIVFPLLIVTAVVVLLFGVGMAKRPGDPVRASAPTPGLAPTPSRTIDAEFVPLTQTLSTRTTIPVWLPTAAPREPGAGMRCRHYGLMTDQNPFYHPPDSYSVTMICWGTAVTPDSPELTSPGAWAMSDYLGELTGSKSRPLSAGLPRQIMTGPPAPTVTQIALTPEVTAQEYSVPGYKTVEWRSTGWQYTVTAGASWSHVETLATWLAQATSTIAPIESAPNGNVDVIDDNHTFTVVDWQVGDIYYELSWYDTHESALAMARALVQVPVGGESFRRPPDLSRRSARRDRAQRSASDSSKRKQCSQSRFTLA